MTSWDIAYVSEKLRESRYSFSQKTAQEYFPLPVVWEGLNAITERLYGIRFVERTGVDVWHPQVKFYEMRDGEKLLGGLYTDLFEREGKRGGAWMDSLVARKATTDALRLPVGILCCNFPQPTDDTPSLLEIRAVETLFHEMGHNLHLLLGKTEYSAVSMESVEWDAIELPSQLLEKWALHAKTIPLLSRHYKTDEALPKSLAEKIRAAKDFQNGLNYSRQFELSLFDLKLFRDYEPSRGSRALELMRETRKAVGVLPYQEYDRIPQSFSHIFAGGYAAGYYSYAWADAMVADCWDRFEKEGIFNPHTAKSYREEILAVGGTRPFTESFVAFRGREIDPEAFFRQKGF
jgi:oligopeptidase A